MLQRYRRMLRRRVRLSLMDWLLIVLFLIVWMVASRPVSPVPTERAIPYIKTSGHVLVQLAKRAARGFRSFKYFQTMAYLKAGKLKLDLPQLSPT